MKIGLKSRYFRPVQDRFPGFPPSLPCHTDFFSSLLSFYGARAGEKLDEGLARDCFDANGQLSPFIEVLHGLCMFGLRHDIAPDLLRSEVRFG